MREGGREEGARCCYCRSHSDFDSVSGDKVSMAPAHLCQESDFQTTGRIWGTRSEHTPRTSRGHPSLAVPLAGKLELPLRAPPALPLPWLPGNEERSRLPLPPPDPWRALRPRLSRRGAERSGGAGAPRAPSPAAGTARST